MPAADFSGRHPPSTKLPLGAFSCTRVPPPRPPHTHTHPRPPLAAPSSCLTLLLLLLAESKVGNIIRGRTTHRVAEELCSALGAVGLCLSAFGWVVWFEAAGMLLVLGFECCGYQDLDGSLSALAMRAGGLAEENPFATVVLSVVAGWCLWCLGLRSSVAVRVSWLTRAFSDEAHDLLFRRELKLFEKHCGALGTSADPIDRLEFARIVKVSAPQAAAGCSLHLGRVPTMQHCGSGRRVRAERAVAISHCNRRALGTSRTPGSWMRCWTARRRSRRRVLSR